MTGGVTKRRCVMVMYDTLCRHFMPSYGNEWVKAPNFQRLAQRTVQFDNFYVGSMPCMPARREMHTGRYIFCIALGGHWSLSMTLCPSCLINTAYIPTK